MANQDGRAGDIKRGRKMLDQLNNAKSEMDEMHSLFKIILSLISFFGCLGNGLVVYTLSRHRYQSRFANLMLVHQSILDAIVCAIAIALVVAPFETQPINSQFNATCTSVGAPFIPLIASCFLWQSQIFYWYFVFASVQNLILIAIDRYLAVFRSIRYKSLSSREGGILIAVLHIYSLFVNIVDLFDVCYEPSTKICHSNYLAVTTSQGFQRFYGVSWFFMVYVIPVVSVFVIYSSIIVKLNNSVRASRSIKDGSNDDSCVTFTSAATSRVQQRAATELTKSTAIITLIFILCFAYDSIFYLLGRLEIAYYEFGSLRQLPGVALVALNSCLNPLVYCIFMKSFRQRITQSLSCCNKSFETNDGLNTRSPS
ncbi:hypothetical protein Ciccas_004401 [Cichlidogyrus casuarinus]|uniref:G-protein coupled receptors family 1 profile domain-containing protein n=1 Tax=Cichlidogyrus casuarinus TaxID=1844966 RepID=A0ABD2QDY0_9PLAT